jgi:L-aspartate oxidase
MQFHPTCLYHPTARNFLISEDLRGEGGELVDRNGRAFMREYTEMGSLAPRDIVARSIDAEMKKTGAECMFLDMTSKSRDFLVKRFPVIFQRCQELGIDMALVPIPIVPAAHYLCGGVLCDVNGRTDVEGLYALGETACTGLHGANRLASNSLLECLAVSHLAAEDFLSRRHGLNVTDKSPPEWRPSSLSNADEMIVIHHMWDEIRRLMWNYVGIVRTDRRLARAMNRLETIQQEINEYYSSFKTHSDIEELRNIALVAQLTVRCAMNRRESRGIHYNLDCPSLLANARDTVL